jgi:hypothetical protein
LQRVAGLVYFEGARRNAASKRGAGSTYAAVQNEATARLIDVDVRRGAANACRRAILALTACGSNTDA